MKKSPFYRLPITLFLTFACSLFFFIPLSWRALWDSDEGRYAEIAREMLELRDWVSPHLNYLLYFEKPPLMYWVTALALRVGGLHAFAARFGCAFFGVLTVLVTYWLGKHWRNPRTGILAACCLATSWGFFALTQYLVLDMALTFWTTFTLYAISRMLSERLPDRISRFAYLAAIAVAGGILTKGPVALVLPAIVTGGVILHQKFRGMYKIPWKGCLLLVLVLAGPWFVLVSLRHPIFLRFFFIHEHLQRYLTTVHHRMEPIYFFIPVILGGFFPWVCFLPQVMRTWSAHHGMVLKRDATGELLIGWILFVTLFFSLSHSKLVAYVLPVFPALALLVGAEFDEAWDSKTIPSWLAQGLVSFILICVVALILIKWPTPISSDPAYITTLEQSGLVAFILGLGVFVGVGVWGMRRTSACFMGVSLVQVILLWGIVSLATQLDPFLSTKAMAERLSTERTSLEPVVVYGVAYETYTQTLPFFLRERVAVYGPPGELGDLPSDQAGPDTDQWVVPDNAAQAALVRSPVGTWVLTDLEHWDALQKTAPAGMFEPKAHQQRFILLQKTL